MPVSFLSGIITDGSLPDFQKSILAMELEQLERYTDPKEGFTLLKPSSYGATLFFEEIDKGDSNIGVVVVPVRLSSLAEYGTPQFVVDKLIQAEERQESRKDAEVIGVGERVG